MLLGRLRGCVLWFGRELGSACYVEGCDILASMSTPKLFERLNGRE
jgi:hypothetical protein